MKKLAIAAAITTAASTASLAGSIEPPIYEPQITEVPAQVVMEDAKNTTGQAWVILLMLAAVIAAAATSS